MKKNWIGKINKITKKPSRGSFVVVLEALYAQTNLSWHEMKIKMYLKSNTRLIHCSDAQLIVRRRVVLSKTIAKDKFTHITEVYQCPLMSVQNILPPEERNTEK